MNFITNNNGNQEIKSTSNEYALDDYVVSAVLYAVDNNDQSSLKT